MASTITSDQGEEISKELLEYMSHAFNAPRERIDEEEDDDDASSSAASGTSSPSHTNYAGSEGHHTDGESKDDNQLFEESAGLRVAKLGVFLCILLFAIIAACSATYIWRVDADDRYVEHEMALTDEMVMQIKKNWVQVWEGSARLARRMSAEVEKQKTSGTFFTVPQFHVYAHQAIQDSGSKMVYFVPFIRGEQLPDYVNYTIHHTEWIQEGLDYEGVSVDPGPVPPVIHANSQMVEPRTEEVKNVPNIKNLSLSEQLNLFPKYHLPTWQVSPVPRNTGFINLDLSVQIPTFLSEDVLSMLYNRKSIVTSMFNGDALVDPVLGKGLPLDDEQVFDGLPKSMLINPRKHSRLPQESFFMYPIYDREIAQLEGDDEDNETSIVGALVNVFELKTVFQNILPAGIGGVFVVLDDGIHFCAYKLVTHKNDTTGEETSKAEFDGRPHELDDTGAPVVDGHLVREISNAELMKPFGKHLMANIFVGPSVVEANPSVYKVSCSLPSWP